MMTNKKTVCMLVYTYFPNATGGAEKQCRLQAHELSRRGYGCLVLTARSRSSLAKREIDNKTAIIRLFTAQPLVDALVRLKHHFFGKGRPQATVSNSIHTQKATKPVGGAAAIVQWLNTFCFMLGAGLFLFKNRAAIHVIHTHIASWNAGFCGWIGRKAGIPVVCKASYLPAFDDFSRSIPFHGKWLQWRKRITYIALTREMADDIAGHGVPIERIHVIPNGVFVPAKIAPVEINSQVLYVGNFSQGSGHKGFDVLINAWALVYKQIPHARLVIAGSGNATPWKVLAEELGCEESIQFAGHVSDISRLYLSSGLFVLPSRGEGISNALLEAQSHGIPAVVSDIPGNREVVVHEKSGLIAPVDDVSAVAEAIARLVRDPELRKRMGDEARARISEHFSIASVVDRQCNVYEMLTGK